MNEHLAGVTILAFGNTSPDVLVNLAEVKASKAVFANSMASSIFVTMFTGGLVCYLSPFRMNAHATVRDILFIMLGVVLIEYVLKQDYKVDIFECMVLVMLYISYLLVNMLDLYMMRRTIKAIEKKIEDLRNQPFSFPRRRKRRMYERQLNEMLNDFEIDVKTKGKRRGERVSGRRSIDPTTTRNIKYDAANSKNVNLFREAWQAVKPINMDEWRRYGIFWRSYLLVKAPVVGVCALFLPLVNHEVDKHGWCKLLNCIQLFTTPSLIFLMGMGYYDRSRNIWYLEIDMTYVPYILPLLPLSLIIFLHSRTDIPPYYHFIFTYLNVAGSMFIIYVCATEIDKIFDLIGTVLDISEDFMGVTLSCACGALGDLVTNAALALQGYEKMAFAATLGGPFFNLLIGTGSTFLGRIYFGLEVEWEEQIGEYGNNCIIFLLLGLSTTLLWSSVLDFRARRSMGIFNILVYALFVLFNVLAENSIVHSYANDIYLEVI
ncbi:mitochondrial sodium/calcium exchanger protein-like isoform X2 [Scaptodrosophila lebanonensis]|nr:mitochondrial sodium/calcium exchanger protein-like isoform X2 [Scaptodrosophila lebanonensis]